MTGTPPPRSTTALALTAVVLTSLSAMLAAMRLRLSVAERAHAWPWPAAAPDPDLVLAIAAAAAVIAAAMAWTRHRDRHWRRSLVESLLWPAVPIAAAWLVAPTAEGFTLATALAVTVAALVAVWLFRSDRRRSASERPAPPGRPRLRWIWVHVAGVGILVALGVWGEGFGDLRAFGLSLLLYPVYAFCQLFLVLAVLWPRLHRLAGGHAPSAVIAVALLFALVHWPNPALVILTGGGMAFWAAAYARGRGLVALAVSMGLLASLASQGLPNNWTDHMRAGPRFVHMRTVPRVASLADRRTRNLPAGERRTTAFLAEVYPDVVGREATPAELERWWRSVAACRRGVLAWRFFISDEYQRKFGAPAGEAPLPDDVHWSRLPAPWPERIDALTREEPGRPPESSQEYLHRLYREILEREASPEEVAGWNPELSERQNRRLVRVLLDQRRELATAPFDTCDCARLGLHH